MCFNLLSKVLTSQSWLGISGSSSSSIGVGVGVRVGVGVGVRVGEGEGAGVGGVGGTSLPCRRYQFLTVNLSRRSSGCD